MERASEQFETFEGGSPSGPPNLAAHRVSDGDIPVGSWRWVAMLVVLWVASVGCSKSQPNLVPTAPSFLMPYSPGSEVKIGPPPTAAPPTAPAAGTTPWNPFTTSSAPTPGSSAITAQMTELERRAKLLDDNNRQLTSQLALSQQQIQLYKERSDLMQKQLSDVSNQLQQSNMAASRMVPAPIATMPAPTVTLPPPLMAGVPAPVASGIKPMTVESSRKSGARLTANVSAPLQSGQGESLRRLGYDVESTNGSIRLRIPADQLFQGGTAQPTPSAAGILDRIAEIVRTEYPRRRVAIEGHTDNAPLYGGTYTTSHQLASAQTSTIFEQWTRRNQLPASQLSTLAHGSNYPLQDNQTPAGRAMNRRVEIVIFEENY